MPDRQDNGRTAGPQGGLAALAIAAFAVVCCAGLPLLVAVAGGLALGTVLGIGAGLAAALLLGGLVISRAHRARKPPGIRDASP